MPTKSEFWSGKIQAKVTQEQLLAEDLNSGNRQLDQTVRLMNAAFRIFYQSRKIISNCTDTKTKTAMRQSLESTGTDGWGRGVSDLDEAFEHLAANQGKWRDGNHTRYWAGPGRIGGFSKERQVFYVTVPSATCNFLTSLNGKAQKLCKLSKEWQQASGAAVKSVQNDGFNRVGTPAWKKMGDAIKKVDAAHEGMKSLFFLASVNEHSKLATSASHVGEVFGAVKKVRGAVETYDKAKTAGNSTLASGAMMALKEGLGAIPVLGKYYQEAFGLLPSVQMGFQRIVDERNALLAKLGVKGAR